MKLLNSLGPNPHVVRMFAAERGIDLEMEEVDVLAAENRQAPYVEKNPSGQSPTLQLDNGDYISEITAICEYLDESAPGDSLLGNTPEERAETRMWTRRIDLNICEPMTVAFRFGEGLSIYQDRIITVPEASEGLKRIVADRIAWLDGLLKGREFVCDNRFTLADVLLYCFLAFGKTVGQPYDEGNKNIHELFQRVSRRASADA
ncbi:MAG: glutathione S-transferase [Gammaproteobacteria bacterium]|nr:glutathione S-transferase [Gammaproteobacteria bacterium]|tara:strand:+ start:629 stop:1240 length:612 start_codon:yes stop_codon:yes gene_type:complete